MAPGKLHKLHAFSPPSAIHELLLAIELVNASMKISPFKYLLYMVLNIFQVIVVGASLSEPHHMLLAVQDWKFACLSGMSKQILVKLSA